MNCRQAGRFNAGSYGAGAGASRSAAALALQGLPAFLLGRIERFQQQPNFVAGEGGCDEHV